MVVQGGLSWEVDSGSAAGIGRGWLVMVELANMVGYWSRREPRLRRKRRGWQWWFLSLDHDGSVERSWSIWWRLWLIVWEEGEVCREERELGDTLMFWGGWASNSGGDGGGQIGGGQRPWWRYKEKRNGGKKKLGKRLIFFIIIDLGLLFLFS